MQCQCPSPCEYPRYSRHPCSAFLQKFLRIQNSQSVLARCFSKKNTLFCSKPAKLLKPSFPQYRWGGDWLQSLSHKQPGMESTHTEARKRESFMATLGGFWRNCPLDRTTEECSWIFSCLVNRGYGKKSHYKGRVNLVQMQKLEWPGTKPEKDRKEQNAHSADRDKQEGPLQGAVSLKMRHS